MSKINDFVDPERGAVITYIGGKFGFEKEVVEDYMEIYDPDLDLMKIVEKGCDLYNAHVMGLRLVESGLRETTNI